MYRKRNDNTYIHVEEAKCDKHAHLYNIEFHKVPDHHCSSICRYMHVSVEKTYENMVEWGKNVSKEVIIEAIKF